eukprot:8562210-Pyramimonas_sp.AAC.1
MLVIWAVIRKPVALVIVGPQRIEYGRNMITLWGQIVRMSRVSSVSEKRGSQRPRYLPQGIGCGCAASRSPRSAWSCSCGARVVDVGAARRAPLGVH